MESAYSWNYTNNFLHMLRLLQTCTCAC